MSDPGPPSTFPSRFAGPGESPGFLLWQTSMRWQRCQREALLALDLTHVQFVLLASALWLGRTHGELTQAALANHAQLDAMMTSQVLRTLEQKGFLTRVAHSRDSRAKAIAVTPEGRALAARALSVVEAVDDRFFAALGEQRQALVEMLATLASPENEGR